MNTSRGATLAASWSTCCSPATAGRCSTKGVVLSVYDPCCGSGGRLTIAKEHVTAGETGDGEPSPRP